MKKRLITSALPYVNNIPHLGNLIQVLSADVFARFCRQQGYETLYVCGTDEYGTATETKAREEGVSPRELCDRFNKIHREIYDWFGINFSHFGRTSEAVQSEIVQNMFLDVYKNGYITEHTIEQLYSEKSDMFLADRYVRGTCPHCGYEDARGDQCENCGKLLEPTELLNPRSSLDGTSPVIRKTSHLYIDLPKLKDKLESWMKEASVKGQWSRNAIQMTQSWIRDGLKERAITRDLKWGIPVPLEGYKHKVFYVWFDAPIGYISISADHTEDWKSWWQNPDEVELFQFIGKDNIPFHTVVFPCTLLASGKPWTMLHHMSSSEYLNYESGKFSKSKGIGVFGTDAKETGIKADVWRFYIFYNRPENADYTFTWKDFQEKVNKELIGNLGNLVNRTLSFWHRFFGAQKPVLDISALSEPWKARVLDFEALVKTDIARITETLEWAGLKDAFRLVFEIADKGNKLFQESEPWKLRKEDEASARQILAHLLYVLHDLAILIQPYMPQASQELLELLGRESELLPGASTKTYDFASPWKEAGSREAWPEDAVLKEPKILFTQLEDEQIEALRQRFSGSQAERKEREEKEQKRMEEKAQTPKSTETAQAETTSLADQFTQKIELRVAKIIDIERHPDSDKLYIEKLDDGSGLERTVVSGLVPYYKPEELLNKHVILVANLKPGKFRGVLSQGMLLAASCPDPEKGEDAEKVEVLFAPQAKPGDQVYVEGSEPAGTKDIIKADKFFAVPLRAEEGEARVGESRLLVAGEVLKTSVVRTGSIG